MPNSSATEEPESTEKSIFRIPNSARPTFVSFLDKWHVGNKKHPLPNLDDATFFLGYLLDHPVSSCPLPLYLLICLL
jgi:hypothetical protein